MSEWKKVTLGELIDSGECAIYDNLRKPLSKIERNKMKYGNLYPYYGAAGVIDFINNYCFDGYYLLIAEDGTITSDGTKPMLQLANGKFWVSNHAHVLQCKNEWKTKFLYYALLNVDINPYITGSVQPKLNQENLFSIPLLIPKSELEQRAIASVLSSLDDKIDLLQRENKTLEAMAETLFRQWFIKEAEKDWDKVPLSEFFDFKEGPGIRNWQFKDKGIPFINIRLISDGEIDVSKANFIDEKEANEKYKHFYLQRKDMVVSTSGTLGKTAIVRNYHLPLLLNTSVIRFRPKDGVNYSFMYAYLNSNEFHEQLMKLASGSVQLNFGPMHLKQITIQLPPKNKLEYFRAIANPIYDKIESNYSQIRTLTQLRDTLLPKLMSGEVRVDLCQS